MRTKILSIAMKKAQMQTPCRGGGGDHFSYLMSFPASLKIAHAYSPLRGKMHHAGTLGRLETQRILKCPRGTNCPEFARNCFHA